LLGLLQPCLVRAGAALHEPAVHIDGLLCGVTCFGPAAGLDQQPGQLEGGVGQFGRVRGGVGLGQACVDVACLALGVGRRGRLADRLVNRRGWGWDRYRNWLARTISDAVLGPAAIARNG
jgi:hypothetical protein